MEPHTERVSDFIDAVVEDEDRARRLLAEEPDLLNARWHLGETVLHFLAVEGYVDGVRRLAEWGANVNLVNRLGDPPLLDCVLLGNGLLVELLLRHGANPNSVSATRGPVLHAAVRHGDPRVVQLLVAAGADPRARTEVGESVFDMLPALEPDRDSILAVFARIGVEPPAG